MDEIEELKAQLAAVSTDRDRLAGEVATTSANLRREYVRVEVERASRKMGCIDEDSAFRLVEGDIQYGEDGRPVNVKEALDGLALQIPRMFGQYGGTGGTGGAGFSGGGGNAHHGGRPRGGRLSRETIEQMTPQEVAVYWPLVQDALANGV